MTAQRQALLLQEVRTRLAQDHQRLTVLENSALAGWYAEQQGKTDRELRDLAYQHGVTFTPRDTAYWTQMDTRAISVFRSSLPGVEAMWVMKNGEIKYSRNFQKYIKKAE
jgi:hypothetical protein